MQAWAGPLAGQCKSGTLPLAKLRELYEKGLMPRQVLVCDAAAVPTGADGKPVPPDEECDEELWSELGVLMDQLGVPDPSKAAPSKSAS